MCTENKILWKDKICTTIRVEEKNVEMGKEVFLIQSTYHIINMVDMSMYG